MRHYFVAALLVVMYSSSQAAWENPLDAVVIATEAVAGRQKPITRVLHEQGPGGWQLYDAGPLKGKPVVLPKTEAMKLDPTLKGVTDLPMGWEATRKSSSEPWVRRRVK